MDEKNFKERVARLEQLGKVVEKLPPEVRAAAFALLEGYVAGTHSSGQSRVQTPKTSSAGSTRGDAAILDISDREAFFSQFEHDKPADNVKLLAAYLYSRYGSAPFPADELRTLADDVGITVPGRLDMTLLQAKERGKQLFARAARGSFKPTVHGESYLKATYRVRKGKEKREAAAK